MAKSPSRGTINQAKARVEAARKKILVRTKPGSAPVPRIPTRQESLKGVPHYSSVRLGLTIRKMIKETLPRTRELMRIGDVVVTKMRKTQSGYSLMCETVTNQPNNNNRDALPSKYKQLVENLDENVDSFSTSKWIKVSCTCPDFKFRKDYALHEKGSSDLKFSTDEPPDETNPIIGGKRNLGVCKHLFAVFERIVQSGR
jgi:hypothetical protein